MNGLHQRNLSLEETNVEMTFYVKALLDPHKRTAGRRYQYFIYKGKLPLRLEYYSQLIYCQELNILVKNSVHNLRSGFLQSLVHELLRECKQTVDRAWLVEHGYAVGKGAIDIMRERVQRQHKYSDINKNFCAEVDLPYVDKHSMPTVLFSGEPQQGIGIGSSLRESINENEPQEGIGIGSSLRED